MIQPKETAHITDIQGGALVEEIDIQLARIVENLLDVNTDTAKKRTLTVKIEFKTDKNREVTHVKAHTQVVLAPSLPVETTMAFGVINGQMSAQELTALPVGQIGFDGKEVQEPPIIVMGGKQKQMEDVENA